MGKNFDGDLESGTVIKLLSIESELNFVFCYKEYRAEKGLLLYAEEGVSEENLMQMMKDKLGAVEVGNLKDRRGVRNYQLGIHKFSRFDQAKELQKFLHCREFLPAIIVKGIVPESLKGMAFLIRISVGHMEKMADQGFYKEIISIRQFLRENPDLIAQELDLLKSSRMWIDSCGKTSFFTSMVTAAQLYCSYFRRNHSEEETDIERDKIAVDIVGIEDECLSYEAEVEAVEAIQKAVLYFFGVDDGWDIAEVNHVDTRTEESIKEANVILYDTKFYYIMEPLFRKSCKNILKIVSFIEIKKILLDSDILCCNMVRNENYTVKKVYMDTNGNAGRGRFLKIRKEFLISEDGLYLEERKGDTYAVFR